MSDTHPDIDLSRLSVQDEVTIQYTSKRTGNPVERDGKVIEVAEREAEDGDTIPVVHVLTEVKTPVKRQYTALTESELGNGDPAVAAVSTVASLEGAFREENAKPGSTYRVSYQPERVTTLGPVRKIVINDSAGAMFRTILDGDA